MTKMLQPQIVEKTTHHFVGLEAAFMHALSSETTNFQVIPPLWDKFFQQVHLVPHRLGNAMFGVIYGRPESERAHPDELQYIAAVQVSSVGEIPAGMVVRTIPAGTFAVFTHRGPIQKLGETCHEIYRVWLPQSDFQHAHIADVELYDHRFLGDCADSELEYWISVSRKASAD